MAEKKKLSIEAPTGKTATDTLVNGGAVVVGFLGARMLRNKVPQVNSTMAKAGIALATLALHASIGGDGQDAEALKGIALGVGVNNLTSLAEEAGDKLLAKRDTDAGTNRALNGALDWAAAALTDNYVPSGGPIAEDEQVQILLQQMGQNGLGEERYALNSQEIPVNYNPLG